MNSLMFWNHGFRLLLPLLFVSGCLAHAPVLSPMQRRQLQMQTFEDASYDTVFRAFKTVLQDDGYVIKNQDMQGGLIVAAIQKSDDSSEYYAKKDRTNNYRTSEGFEVSINLEPINETISEARVVIQKTEQYSLGGTKGEEILEPDVYREFFNRVSLEVERRKAMGKL